MAAASTVGTLEIDLGFRTEMLSQLPDDVLCNLMSFLDANALCKMRMINKKFKRLASKNSAGWDHLCQSLWKAKIHVSREARQELQSSSSSSKRGDESAMSAYRISLLDSQNRDHVTREELIFDPETGSGTIWSFRFKEAAGIDWTTVDPWYNNQPCRKMVFLEDGSVKMYVPSMAASQVKKQKMDDMQTDTSIGEDDMDLDEAQPTDTEASNATTRPALVEPQYNVSNPDTDSSGGNLRDPPAPMTWRFVNQPLDFPDRPVGSYIRFSVFGREVPTYVCRRSPNDNWGFVMESCWGVYASFELPLRPKDPDASNVRRRRRQRRLRRSLNLQLGHEIHFQVEVDDSSDDEDYEPPSGDDALIYDDYFNVTTELQWREAFLYNNFALPTLPEGSDALADFRRNYGV
mmetsp:Transcript_22182/g.54933  ORF Transcript_22182/g.54933 Transcript_22182/m.54933 type:complete len:405 (-) Transcript_22182:78-1292(-)|eukprot:CAMPEP_0116087778 /NCGR_PEP_ID=MMETSP0327-20121206/5535_1 /TAXON_ID=44447 /ORGANISM="Pseudo-nitzschia delicatissima, Strain B596" /LENGTH=404 /DNA_ID=CAMNT_0003578849 /DNA_START=83 /DNA_END=1297 /DNA_ORIENTATION=+